MEKFIDLVVTKYWYDQLTSKRKHIEYRNVTPYYASRLGFKYNGFHTPLNEEPIPLIEPSERYFSQEEKMSILFRSGYVKEPLYCVPVTYIDIGLCPYKGWDGWYFRIHLWNKETKVVYPKQRRCK